MKNLLNNNRVNIASQIYIRIIADGPLTNAERLNEIARLSLDAADAFIAVVYARDDADEPVSDRAKPWWCEGCKDFVSPDFVAFDETHDTLRGGCGGHCK